jgi:hypothetical protein
LKNVKKLVELAVGPLLGRNVFCETMSSHMG